MPPNSKHETKKIKVEKKIIGFSVDGEEWTKTNLSPSWIHPSNCDVAKTRMRTHWGALRKQQQKKQQKTMDDCESIHRLDVTHPVGRCAFPATELGFYHRTIRRTESVRDRPDWAKIEWTEHFRTIFRQIVHSRDARFAQQKSGHSDCGAMVSGEFRLKHWRYRISRKVILAHIISRLWPVELSFRQKQHTSAKKKTQRTTTDTTDGRSPQQIECGFTHTLPKK